MSKKVLIISGSPRKGGNSDLLCDEFMRGAVDAGNNVTKIRAAEKKIGFCSACYYCRKSASPVYFYSIDAQMKALIDRTLARWTEVKDKEFYYIVTCADTDKASQETTLSCFRGYADCVEGAEEKGVIYGTGVYQSGEIKKSSVFKQAYEMGKTVR